MLKEVQRLITLGLRAHWFEYIVDIKMWKHLRLNKINNRVSEKLNLKHWSNWNKFDTVQLYNDLSLIDIKIVYDLSWFILFGTV